MPSWSSGHVEPSLSRDWVVARTGTERAEAARRSLVVVESTAGKAWMAGRNFSWRSHMLCYALVEASMRHEVKKEGGSLQ